MGKKKQDIQVDEVMETASTEEVVEVIVEPVEKVKSIKSDESPRFSLSQLVQSNRYKKYAYLLEAKLSVDKKYTLAEVDELVKGLI